MSSFILKIIALISMLFDHTGYIIFNQFSFMNYIGRLAFPIFAFFISEGYTHTKNLKNYFLRLFIFALLSQIPYSLFLHTFSTNLTLNILFTLTLGLATITIYEKVNNKSLGLLLTVLCAALAEFMNFDYGYFGILIIFIFHIFKNNKLFMNLSFCIVTFINYFHQYILTLRFEYIYIIICCCLSLIFINLYNGKKGINTKYLLYLFYPFHLLLLYFISLYC